jgi:hypothetical protein
LAKNAASNAAIFGNLAFIALDGTPFVPWHLRQLSSYGALPASAWSDALGAAATTGAGGAVGLGAATTGAGVTGTGVTRAGAVVTVFFGTVAAGTGVAFEVAARTG